MDNQIFKTFLINVKNLFSDQLDSLNHNYCEGSRSEYSKRCPSKKITPHFRRKSCFLNFFNKPWRFIQFIILESHSYLNIPMKIL